MIDFDQLEQIIQEQHKTIITTISKCLNSTVTENTQNIPGLYYISNYLDKPEIDFILKKIDSDIKFYPITKSKNSRRVAHFGYYYSYDRSGLKPAPEIPNYLCYLVNKKLVNTVIDKNIINDDFDQCIINEYKPGQQISWHTDHVKQFGPIIACISIGQSTFIKFRLGPNEKIIRAESGSLYIMTNAARYQWQHSLSNTGSNVRYSLTFRNVIKN